VGRGRIRLLAPRWSKPSSSSFWHLVEAITVRELLESFVMERALEIADQALLAGLRRNLEEMEEAARRGDREAMVVSHDKFHAQFHAHADHRLILSIYDRVRVPLQSHVRLQQIGYRMRPRTCRARIA
jgi:DNA-binding GntR family transcriptional regulator